MNARKIIPVTPEDLIALNEAVQKVAQNAAKVAEMCRNGEVEEIKTDGIKVGVKGIDALAKVYAKYVGKPMSTPPDLHELRTKLGFFDKLEKDASKIAEKASASKKTSRALTRKSRDKQ